MTKRMIISLSILFFASAICLSQESRRQKTEILQTALPNEIRTVLEKGQQFDLLSLDPAEIRSGEDGHEKQPHRFHGYTILNTTPIRDLAERQHVLRALYKSIEDSDGRFDLCFRPRHGLRVTSGTEKVDIVICFECRSIRIYSPERAEVLITDSARDIFDRALTGK